MCRCHRASRCTHGVSCNLPALHSAITSLASFKKAGADVLVLLQVEKGVFTWESAGGDTSSAYMKDISFEARPGTLTMVVGSVASGKTSLLSALIGQMERLQGTVAVGGRVAYVAQTAWIINDSVQVGVGLGPDRGHGCGNRQQCLHGLHMSMMGGGRLQVIMVVACMQFPVVVSQLSAAGFVLMFHQGAGTACRFVVDGASGCLSGAT